MPQESRAERLRRIPAVDQFLVRPEVASWVDRTSHVFVVSQIQALLGDIRTALLAEEPAASVTTEPEALAALLEHRLQQSLRPSLEPLINATGVILHTNLGRAPLSAAAQESLSAVGAGYTNLEFDLGSGGRSHRDQLVEPMLRQLLGCEAAVVVNNNSAAVFLILNTLAAGREVVVSRGELVEIGGSFRIPDILARSGARLREVGTTNKTRIADYEAALGPETALLLRVHPSNFRIRGFAERPTLREVSELGRRRGIPLVEDVGSGCLLDLRPYGIADEPVPQESLSQGADLVCFSADKLLGGPQAGIIAGRRELVQPVRTNPLMRTYRVEKLIYGALEATLSSYRTGKAMVDLPVLRCISMPLAEIRRRAGNLCRRLRKGLPAGVSVGIVDGESVIGGGSCPDTVLSTKLVSIRPAHISVSRMEARLRAHAPPVVLRLEEDRALVDLRTVFPAQEKALLAAILQALEPD